MRFTELPRPVLLGLALLLAGASVSYSAIWMYYARWERIAWLGLRTEYSIRIGTQVLCIEHLGGGVTTDAAEIARLQSWEF